MSASEIYNVVPVGTVSGTQHNLQIEIKPEYRAALKGLEAFSHCQILWWIHEFADDIFRTTTQIEPPYDAPVTGVFASRSPVRPNPIGLTVAEIISVDAVEGIIEVGGLDAYPGTPVRYKSLLSNYRPCPSCEGSSLGSFMGRVGRGIKLGQGEKEWITGS